MKVFCLVYNLTFIVGENQTQIRRLSEITENEILAKKKKKKKVFTTILGIHVPGSCGCVSWTITTIDLAFKILILR